MHKTFTQNDLVRFLYGEMNTEESKMLQFRILEDECLRDELLDLKQTFDLVNSATKPNPSRLSELLIASYASSYSVVKIKNHNDFDDFAN